MAYRPRSLQQRVSEKPQRAPAHTASRTSRRSLRASRRYRTGSARLSSRCGPCSPETVQSPTCRSLQLWRPWHPRLPTRRDPPEERHGNVRSCSLAPYDACISERSMGCASTAAVGCYLRVTRKIVPLASSLTSSAPSRVTATPAGRPQALSLSTRNPVMKSSYSPVGAPSFMRTRITL
jgi:hypothetical protein